MLGNIEFVETDIQAAAYIADMNLDGVVDAVDVAPFVLALTDPLAYETQHAIDPAIVGDINQDGVLDAVDVAPFVELLVGEQTAATVQVDEQEPMLAADDDQEVDVLASASAMDEPTTPASPTSLTQSHRHMLSDHARLAMWFQRRGPLLDVDAWALDEEEDAGLLEHV
ncbi:MAG: hypothetical protein WD316_12865 [Phycisphaeraceae bacterium]